MTIEKTLKIYRLYELVGDKEEATDLYIIKTEDGIYILYQEKDNSSLPIKKVM